MKTSSIPNLATLLKYAYYIYFKLGPELRDPIIMLPRPSFLFFITTNAYNYYRRVSESSDITGVLFDNPKKYSLINAGLECPR